MGGWGCPHEVNGTCEHLDGATCRPGMKGCVLAGKVTFHDDVTPFPVWPPGHPRSGDAAPPADQNSKNRVSGQ